VSARVTETAATDVRVRPSRDDEIARLAAWNAMLIRDERHDNEMTGAELTDRLREWLAAEYRACVFEIGGKPFGYALFRDLSDCTHVRHFFVEAAYRRRGLGRKAFERLRSDAFAADKRVLVEVLVDNARGVAFWKSVGFGERYLGMQLPPSPPASSH
jgi:GNAT superfamily N-acetyltransferase